MKKVIWVLLAITMLPSCANDKPGDMDSGTPITVSLGVGGDVNVSSSPLTKGPADQGIYGINVYFDKEKDGKTDNIYAYGLFDNISDMVITLLSGYKYRFACTYARNGEHSLYYGQYDGNKYQGYAKPFQTNKKSSTQLGNAFVYSNSTGEYLSGIGTGDAVICNLSTGAATNQTYPRIYRFYGELDSYSPVAGGTVTIPLKRTNYKLNSSLVL